MIPLSYSVWIFNTQTDITAGKRDKTLSFILFYIHIISTAAKSMTHWSTTQIPTPRPSVLAWKPSSMSASTLSYFCTVSLESAMPTIQTPDVRKAAGTGSGEVRRLFLKTLTTSILWPRALSLSTVRRERWNRMRLWSQIRACGWKREVSSLLSVLGGSMGHSTHSGRWLKRHCT